MRCEIRQLRESDYPIIEHLILKNQTRQPDYNYQRGLYWIQNSYLPAINNQAIFGAFIAGSLIAVYSIRLHFPRVGTAVVGNAFSNPSNLNYKNVKILVEAVFDYANLHGCDTILAVVKAQHAQRQRILCPAYVTHDEEVISRSVDVAGLPDWLQSMLGRTQPATDYILRKMRIVK